MPEPIPADEVIDLIAAIRDAISVPEPASYAQREAQHDLLTERAAYVRGVLKSSADGTLGSLAITAQILRDISYDVPVRYETYQGGTS